MAILLHTSSTVITSMHLATPPRNGCNRHGVPSARTSASARRHHPPGSVSPIHTKASGQAIQFLPARIQKLLLAAI